MWSASTSHARLPLALVAALVLGGCGPRNLGLTLTVDTSGCTLSIPAGGSILYQVEANGSTSADGGGSFCGACLTVDSAIDNGDALVAFLRTHAPSCGSVHPNTTLAVRVSGWSAAGCPSPMPPESFCADAPSQLVPDGTSDGTLTFKLVCQPQCATVCAPTTCAAQGKNCGAISDGCNMVLECGTCHPPLRCGAQVPNVCGR